VKELDNIKIFGHFDFKLLLEGSDLGCSFGNCWSWGNLIFYTHGKLRDPLNLNKKRVLFRVLLVFETIYFSCF
jgi:hypothetical protein